MPTVLFVSVLCAALGASNPAWSKPYRDLVVEEMVSEQRVALVIGNSSYNDAPLKNPVNDARAMAATLKEVGFDVIEQIDADRLQMRRAIREFGNQIRRGGVGLFYYAGHGIQIDGQNYLVPIDADVQHEDEVEDVCVLASSVLRKMNSAGNRINIVVLDACRNNPFARSFRSSTRGLARMDAPSGTILGYATSPGKVAADGDGDNGLYTANLLQHIKEPGLKIEEVFKQVRIKVDQQSNGAQLPWEETSLTGDFYFVVPQEDTSPPPPPPPTAQAYLQVWVSPVAGNVYVNDKLQGKTLPGQSLNLTGFSPGEVKVRVEAPGYHSAEATVTLQAGNWVTAPPFELLPIEEIAPPPPPPLKASILVNVTTVEASVYVEGQYRGKSTPQSPLMLADLQPGQREIRLEAPGYESSTQTHQLVGGKRADLYFKLRPKELKVAPSAPTAVKGNMVQVGDLGFSIDRHEVTNAQFAQFLNAQNQQGQADHIERIEEGPAGYRASAKYTDHPVVQVTWYEAKAYCAWAGKRLPKVDEWEQACRGNEKTIYPWGNEPPRAELANYKHQSSTYRGTAPVGSFPAGASLYGALDMSGNVMEWTATARGDEKELRGGSWQRINNYQRCTSNYFHTPDKRFNHWGFRCAR